MTVNGDAFDIATLGQSSSLVALIEHFKLSPQRVAIELNGEIIARGDYSKAQLSGDDIVEIIHYVGGG